ncbi:hypothetical protein P7C70_g8071, partial [Phenoliferia sp. Uapishka_3]
VSGDIRRGRAVQGWPQNFDWIGLRETYAQFLTPLGYIVDGISLSALTQPAIAAFAQAKSADKAMEIYSLGYFGIRGANLFFRQLSQTFLDILEKQISPHYHPLPPKVFIAKVLLPEYAIIRIRAAHLDCTWEAAEQLLRESSSFGELTHPVEVLDDFPVQITRDAPPPCIPAPSDQLYRQSSAVSVSTTSSTIPSLPSLPSAPSSSCETFNNFDRGETTASEHRLQEEYMLQSFSQDPHLVLAQNLASNRKDAYHSFHQPVYGPTEMIKDLATQALPYSQAQDPTSNRMNISGLCHPEPRLPDATTAEDIPMVTETSPHDFTPSPPAPAVQQSSASNLGMLLDPHKATAEDIPMVTEASPHDFTPSPPAPAVQQSSASNLGMLLDPHEGTPQPHFPPNSTIITQRLLVEMGKQLEILTLDKASRDASVAQSSPQEPTSRRHNRKSVENDSETPSSSPSQTNAQVARNLGLPERGGPLRTLMYRCFRVALRRGENDPIPGPPSDQDVADSRMSSLDRPHYIFDPFAPNSDSIVPLVCGTFVDFVQSEFQRHGHNEWRPHWDQSVNSKWNTSLKYLFMGIFSVGIESGVLHTPKPVPTEHRTAAHYSHLYDIHFSSLRDEYKRQIRNPRGATKKKQNDRIGTRKNDLLERRQNWLLHNGYNHLLRLLKDREVCSDDEDAKEGDPFRLRARRVPKWRSRSFTMFLEEIDRELVSSASRLVGRKGGRLPEPRVPSSLPELTCVPPRYLPIDCYDAGWLSTLSKHQLQKLGVEEEKVFPDIVLNIFLRQAQE